MTGNSIVARGGKVIAEAALGLIVGVIAYPMVAGAEVKSPRETLTTAWHMVAPSSTL